MAAKKDLVIVESPAKARTIEKYLGTNYKVIASMGHLRDLPKSKIGVDIEGGFVPQYIPVTGRDDVIGELQKRAKSAGIVYLATDPDREGEAISWHLKELLNLPDSKARRVTFNEITKKVVQEGIANPRALKGSASMRSQDTRRQRQQHRQADIAENRWQSRPLRRRQAQQTDPILPSVPAKE